MRRIRFHGSAAGAVVVAIVLAACSSSGTGGSASTAPAASTAGGGAKPYIAIVSKGSQHQFWQAVQKGATDEAAAKGATITY
jgi:ribose transport system substrate-binding protein